MPLNVKSNHPREPPVSTLFSIAQATGNRELVRRASPFGGSTLQLAKLSFNLAYAVCKRRVAVLLTAGKVLFSWRSAALIQVIALLSAWVVAWPNSV